MVLLQDLEEKLKREERKKKTSPALVKVVARFVAVVLAVGIATVLLVRTLQQTKNQNANSNTNNTNQPTASNIVPIDERANQVRTALPPGTFALVAAPDVKSGKSESTLIYDLRVVRKQGFLDDITLDVNNIPSGATVLVSPERISGDTTDATVALTLPKDPANGTYTMEVVGSAGAKTATANVSVAVSALELSNTEVTNRRKMTDGTKWQATITWKTNASTNSWIEFAPEAEYISRGLAYAFTSIDQSATNDHTITLTYLEPDTVYHYRARSVDPQNTVVVGEDKSFRTGE